MPMISCSKCGVHFDDCTGKKPAPQENEYDGYLCEPCYDEEADNHDGFINYDNIDPVFARIIRTAIGWLIR